MTALNFAGGSEFAAIQLWGTAPPVLTIALVTLLINSRHIVMGASLTPYLRDLPKRKVLPALFFMADEGWALSYSDTLKSARENRTPAFSWPFYLGSCTPFYPVWVGFAVLGALAGPILGDINSYGFAMAFPAVFIVLLRGMWKGVRFAGPWFVTLAVAIATYRLVPGAWFVLAGTLAGLISTYFWTANE
jgi:4-azaleucine resistance transporter AzlC